MSERLNYEMKVRTVGEEEEWWEQPWELEEVESFEEASRVAQGLVKYFNGSLRGSDVAREFVAVREIQDKGATDV